MIDRISTPKMTSPECNANSTVTFAVYSELPIDFFIACFSYPSQEGFQFKCDGEVGDLLKLDLTEITGMDCQMIGVSGDYAVTGLYCSNVNQFEGRTVVHLRSFPEKRKLD